MNKKQRIMKEVEKALDSMKWGSITIEIHGNSRPSFVITTDRKKIEGDTNEEQRK